MTSRAAPTLAAEPRNAARHKVFLPAEMTDAAGASRVHLLNLSPSGALMHGDVTPRPGAVVRIECAGTSWSVRVVWAHQKRFGVVHTTPLTDRVVETLVAGQAGA